LQHKVEHLQELIPEEPEEDPEEVEGMSGVRTTRLSMLGDYQGTCESLVVFISLLF
jgi:hypothetical protein